MISGFASVTQILDAMNQDSRVPLAQLQVDGGMTSNRLLMQLQADILGVTVGENMAVGAFIPDCAELNQTKPVHLFRTTQFPGNWKVTAFASLLRQIIK